MATPSPSVLMYCGESCVKGKRTPHRVAGLATGMVAMYCRHQGCKIHSRLPPHAGDLPRYYTRNTEQSRPEFDGDELHTQSDMSMVP
jgi:hypothetical protein